MTLLEYIRLHKPAPSTIDGATVNCCWDCPDKVFDAVITVDCSVDHDGKVDIIDNTDAEFPNMPLFIKECLGKVIVVSLMSDGTPIIDADGLFRRNIDTVKQWCSKNWNGDWSDTDDIIYQMIQEIHYGIAGYKGNSQYGSYLKLLRSCDIEC